MTMTGMENVTVTKTDATVTGTAMNEPEGRGRFAWIAEAAALILIVLLPLKAGALIGPPSITMIYWSDLYSILLSPWPFPVFLPIAGAFLLLTVLAVPSSAGKNISTLYVFFWTFLVSAGSLAGLAGPSAVPDCGWYFACYGFSLGCLLAGFLRVLAFRKDALFHFGTALAIGLVFSLISGGEQYFSGFRETTEQMMKQCEAHYSTLGQGILNRLKEARVSAGFSSCNAYAGYLILVLPPVTALLFLAGKYAEPEKLSRWILPLPVLLFGLFLLLKTGSRGAILSLATAVFLTFLLLKTGKKLKIILFSLIPLAAGAFTMLVLLGRGAKSMVFRFDYFQGAFRMILEHPLTGCGWGGFQRAFMVNKLIFDAEAPASPHNLPLTFGSQTGLLFFLIACTVVLLPLICGSLRLRKMSFKEAFSRKELFATLLFTGFAAWCFQSMQDVLYETFATASLGSLAGGIVLFTCMERSPVPVKRMALAANILFLLLGTVTMYEGNRLLKFDSSLAALNDMVDPNMVSPEEWKKIDPVRVSDFFQRCTKLNPRSPYPYLTLSSFLGAKGDFIGSLQMLDEAIRRDPSSSGLHYRKYRYLSQFPEYAADACLELEKAVHYFPMNPKYQKEWNSRRRIH